MSAQEDAMEKLRKQQSERLLQRAQWLNARIYAEKMRRHAEEFRLYQANQGAI